MFTVMNSVSKRIPIALLTDCLEDFAGGAEKQIFEPTQYMPAQKS